MPAVILRLLTLFALVLMPFGMGAASASPVHHAPATASARHCDEQSGQPSEQVPDPALDCAMSCSMLAATEAEIEDIAARPGLPAARALEQRGSGLHPDTATPPPKLS